jgi:SWI/SNF-related matrix-associated actin-dependent regulator of chromatin subfamily A member 5
MKNSPGVNLGLPPKTDILLFMPLTPMQRFWYTRLITRVDQGLLEELFQGAKQKEKKVRAQEKEQYRALDRIEISELVREDGEINLAGDGWEESKLILAKAIKQEQEQEAEDNTSAWRKLMNLVMQLRKACIVSARVPVVKANRSSAAITRISCLGQSRTHTSMATTSSRPLPSS